MQELTPDMEFSIIKIAAKDPSEFSFKPDEAVKIGDYLLVISLIAGAISYWRNQYLNRKQESDKQAWQRIQFLFQQFQVFDNDQKISEAVDILAGRIPAVKTANIFLESSKEAAKYLASFDRMLSFLEQIAYAVENSTLTTDDISLFEWYFNAIIENKSVHAYACQYYPGAVKIGNSAHAKLKDRQSSPTGPSPSSGVSQ